MQLYDAGQFQQGNKRKKKKNFKITLRISTLGLPGINTKETLELGPKLLGISTHQFGISLI